MEIQESRTSHPRRTKDFDFSNPSYYEDPYSDFQSLRSQNRIFYSEVMKGWVVMGYKELEFALKSRKLKMTPLPDLLDFGPFVKQALKSTMLFNDGPEHLRLRKPLVKAFSQKMIVGLEDTIYEVAKNLLKDIQGPTFDFIESYAYPFPLLVICHLLGIPKEDFTIFQTLAHPLARSIDVIATPQQRAESDEASQAMEEYIRALILKKEKNLGNDLISDLIRDNQEKSTLSTIELVRACTSIFFAGHETTVNLLGNGLNLLLSHPQQLDLLLKKPELLDDAIEEMLRLDPPAQFTMRFLEEDLDIYGKIIPGPSPIHCCIASANHDSEVFQEPEVFNIQRRQKGLSFGGGVHSCIGEHLARLEAKIAFKLFLERFPKVRFASHESKIRRTTIILRGFTKLPVDV